MREHNTFHLYQPRVNNALVNGDSRSTVWGFSLKPELLPTSYKADVEHSNIWDFFRFQHLVFCKDPHLDLKCLNQHHQRSILYHCCSRCFKPHASTELPKTPTTLLLPLCSKKFLQHSVKASIYETNESEVLQIRNMARHYYSKA